MAQNPSQEADSCLNNNIWPALSQIFITVDPT